MIFALLLLLAAFPHAAPAQSITAVTGAGATFPAFEPVTGEYLLLFGVRVAMTAGSFF